MIEILWQDAQALVCCKPVGVCAQGEDAAALPALLSAQTGAEIYSLHRLDQAVGGVMVFAKTKQAAGKLGAAIAENRLGKEYLAVLEKRPPEDDGELCDLLFHDRTKNKTYVVSRERKGVKQAKLSYRVLAENEAGCLVHVRLHTGRTHQIRVQFASRHCPLAGDGKYGSRKNARAPALWSFALTIPAGSEEKRIFMLPQGGIWESFAEELRALVP